MRWVQTFFPETRSPTLLVFRRSAWQSNRPLLASLLPPTANPTQNQGAIAKQARRLAFQAASFLAQQLTFSLTESPKPFHTDSNTCLLHKRFAAQLQTVRNKDDNPKHGDWIIESPIHRFLRHSRARRLKNQSRSLIGRPWFTYLLLGREPGAG
jgi:hypothetical protein